MLNFIFLQLISIPDFSGRLLLHHSAVCFGRCACSICFRHLRCNPCGILEILLGHARSRLDVSEDKGSGWTIWDIAWVSSSGYLHLNGWNSQTVRTKTEQQDGSQVQSLELLFWAVPRGGERGRRTAKVLTVTIHNLGEGLPNQPSTSDSVITLAVCCFHALKCLLI